MLPPRMSSSSTPRLIASRAERGGDDPIFALNAEAQRRRAAGESIVNSTLGALYDEELRLATLPAVAEAFRRIPQERAAAYAPIAGPPAYLAAVVADLLSGSPLREHAAADGLPNGIDGQARLEHGHDLGQEILRFRGRRQRTEDGLGRDQVAQTQLLGG